LTPSAWGLALSAAEEAVEEARRELAEYTPVGALPPRAVLVQLKETAEADPAAALEQLRVLTARVIERVEVRQGRASEAVEDKVRIVWRDGTVTPAEVDVWELLADAEAVT
jgi:hypothetical protein